MAESISSKLDRETEGILKREATDLELEKLAKIKEMYAAGIPFFTKDSIREIHQQLSKAKTGDKVSVLNLDGTRSKFEITAGKVYPPFLGSDSETDESDFVDPPDSEVIHTKPVIVYQCIQALITWSRQEFEIVDLCPMPIHHVAETRNKITKEFCGHSKARPDLPHEEGEEFFESCRKKWEASEPCKEFRSMLETIEIPLGITKIVAFACGPFSFAVSELSTSREVVRRATQHALILTLRDILSKTNGGPSREITCYAQDPFYSSLDQDILEKYNIRILDDPVGFLEVDESTVVLSFSANVCVRQVVCDIARPAMMIWDRIEWDKDEMAEEERTTDPDSPRLKKMIKDGYEELKMPGTDDKSFYESEFGDAGIYIKQAGTTSRL